MFRSVRKKSNEITLDTSKELLTTARRGVLSLNGDDGYPYAIPINYLYDEDEQKIFFHRAKAGYKIDALKKSDKVCFTVYGNESIKEESWAPYLQSAIIFGRCHLIEDTDRGMKVLKDFAMKYYPNEEMVDKQINISGKATQIFEISIEFMSGKQIQEK